MTHFVRILLLALLCSVPLAQAGKPGGGGTTNQAPRVYLVAPGTGLTLAPGSDLVLQAEAFDTDGSITQVAFYRGTTLIGSVSGPGPYSLVWPTVPAGTHSLSAKATDNAGAVTTSSAISLTVAPPGINVVAPINGAIVYGSTITVSGSATGPADSTVLVDNGISTRQASFDGVNFSTSFPLVPGSNTLTVAIARADKTSASTGTTLKVTRASPPLITFTAPVASSFDAPANIGLVADAVSPTSSLTKVEFFKNGSLLGTSNAPPYTFNWNNVPTGSYTLSARATDVNGQIGSASLPITVLGPNVGPTVALSAPGAGATYPAPATINVTATASDPDGSITQVAFYQNGSFLAATNVAPDYAFSWTNVAAGSYTLTAQATDNRGATTTSAPVNVTVSPPSVPPTVSLIAPSNGATYLAPALINLTATASDPDGSISRVDFYQGSALIGTSGRQAPYTASWTASQTGTYILTAKATDNAGVATTSAPVTVNVLQATVTYYHDDLLGSPIAATDEAGNVLWKENYKPYGERVNNSVAAAGERNWYTGKAQDRETGLTYFGARYYDPAIGRFMAVDAADFSEKNLHSFNRYAYANNNPYKFVDPDGNSPIDALFLAADVIKFGVAAYTGVGVGAAAVDVAISTAAMFSPVPGAGEVYKGLRAAEHAAEIYTGSKLAKNMAEAGNGVVKGAEEAHHIVAQNAKAAEPARKVLEKHGIKINSAENGAAMATGSHRGVHTKEYYQGVNDAMRKADSGPNAGQQVRDVLQKYQGKLEGM